MCLNVHFKCTLRPLESRRSTAQLSRRIGVSADSTDGLIRLVALVKYGAVNTDPDCAHVFDGAENGATGENPAARTQFKDRFSKQSA